MTANNAIHQRRHQRVTSMSTALCGLVMASVIRIQQAVDRKSHLVPIGSTMHG